MRVFFLHPALLIALALPVTVCAQDLPRSEASVDESHPGIETSYGALTVDEGVRLRTILTRPADPDPVGNRPPDSQAAASSPRPGSADHPPVILFLQWLSCDTVELRADRQDGWSQMLRGMIRESGWAVMRTEKRGVGDSEGEPCSALDYETELSDHRAALAALRQRDDVDPQKIVVFGASMGSRMAGQVAAGVPGIVGVLGWGGGSKTWFERMLAFDRNALELGDGAAGDISRKMRARAALYSRYLLDGEDPPDIVATDAEMAGTWSEIIGTSATAHYGRPFAFHQQAQRADFATAWSRIDVPVLMTMGEFDWFENRAGHETVVRIVNRSQPGLASFEVIPDMDHHFTLFDSAEAAFGDEGGTADASPFLSVALKWLNER